MAARIDHIAQVVPVGHPDAWVLFYRAVLGLSPAAGATVIHDPYGVVRSRAVESADRAVRYALNVSDRSNTAVARSVSSFAGAGVHHVAVAVDDALDAARRLAARGVPILPIPANYDDLAAKHDLEPGLLSALQANNVLYDRDGGGEYLHFYTVPFDERFYLEVIERRGCYAHYGAANAPTRLAALADWRAHAAAAPAADIH